MPAGKLRDKGTPIENLSKFDGAKDTIVYLTSAEDMKGRIFVFATKMAMVKQVPSEEFETNNRVVAATKLQEGDELAAVIPVEGETEVVIQTTGACSCGLPWRRYPCLKRHPEVSEASG